MINGSSAFRFCWRAPGSEQEWGEFRAGMIPIQVTKHVPNCSWG